MGEVKQHQPPMTIDEQIENLKNIGLIVEDEEYAKRILNDISYFRLIKAYSLNLKTNEGRYRENITFQQLVDLYLFNANFRQIIFPEIEYEKIDALRGLNISITTTAKTDEESKALLSAFKFPFRN